MAAASGLQIVTATLIAASGASFNAIIKRLRVSASALMVDTSGSGDGGNSTFIEGKRVYRFSCSGVVQSDSARNPGFNSTTGLGGGADTLTLTFATGRTLAGSAFVSNLEIVGGYDDGYYRVTFTGVFTGAVTETWS